MAAMDTLIKVGIVGAVAYFGYEFFFATPAAPAAAPAGTPAAPAPVPPAPVPPAAPPVASYNTAAALFSRITAAASAQGMTGSQSPDAWNTVFNSQGGPGPLPDPVSLFGSHDPLTLAQWWAGTAGWLAANKGLTGLAVYAGLGRLAFGGR